MSVWSCREIHKGRKGQLSGLVDRKYTRVFQVRMTSQLDGPIEAMFAIDPNTLEAVPRLYSTYANFGTNEVDLLAMCQSIDPVQDDDDWSVWTVTCEYSTDPIANTGDGERGNPDDAGDPRTGGGASADPELEPPVFEWSHWTREDAQAYEPAGRAGLKPAPLLNSMGKPFDPLPTRETGGRILIVERNERYFDSEGLEAWSYKVNSLPFIDVLFDDTLCWLCKPITGRRAYKGLLAFWRVRYEFWHNPAVDKDGNSIGWSHYLLDFGFPVPGDAGKLLDGKGGILSAADAADPKKGPVFLQFQKYAMFDFTELNIKVPG